MAFLVHLPRRRTVTIEDEDDDDDEDEDELLWALLIVYRRREQPRWNGNAAAELPLILVIIGPFGITSVRYRVFRSPGTPVSNTKLP